MKSFEFEKVLDLLKAKRTGNGFSGRCPIHDDKRASLSLNLTTKGKLLVYCHAGCDQRSVYRAVTSLLTEERI